MVDRLNKDLEDFKIGDRVSSEAPSGRVCEGTVVGFYEGDIVVKWDDGNDWGPMPYDKNQLTRIF